VEAPGVVEGSGLPVEPLLLTGESSEGAEGASLSVGDVVVENGDSVSSSRTEPPQPASPSTVSMNSEHAVDGKALFGARADTLRDTRVGIAITENCCRWSLVVYRPF
jgi:hypothetical protein